MATPLDNGADRIPPGAYPPLEHYMPDISIARARRVRARIRTGFYARRDVLLETARRIIESGDTE